MKNFFFGLAMMFGVATLGAGEARADQRYGNGCNDHGRPSYSAYDYRPISSRSTQFSMSSYPYTRLTYGSLDWNSRGWQDDYYRNYSSSTAGHYHYLPARSTYNSVYGNSWNYDRPSYGWGTTTNYYPRSGYGW